MLLKNKIKKYSTYIGLGQLSLILGILFSVLSRADWLENAFMNPSTGSWIVGFMAGLSGILFGLSIVLNIKGFQMRRANQE